jgi:thiol-disulfide isomerase/thioredoxin
MFNKVMFALIFMMMILFQGCDDKQTQHADQMVTKHIFELSDTQDSTISITKEGDSIFLSDDKEKLIIIDIFATWCPPCKAVAPHLGSLQAKYSEDIKIIGVTIQDDISNEELNKFKDDFDAKYTIVNSKENRKLTSAIAASIGLGERFAIPTMVMYKNGKYITHYVGAVPEEMVESDIKLALGK